MCVAIFKPANVPIPSRDTLETCWFSNPDGGGYCYAKDRIVRGRKGYMRFDPFYKAIQLIPKEVSAILHMRIATHGEITADATHPFPITSSLQGLTALVWTAQFGVAHNGIISGYGEGIDYDYGSLKRYNWEDWEKGTKKKGKKKKGYELSDTQAYIKDILSDLHIRQSMFVSEGIQKLIKESTKHSRLIILNGDGKALMLGVWEKYQGCFYSNSSYKIFTTDITKYVGGEVAKPMSLEDYRSIEGQSWYEQFPEDDWAAEIVRDCPMEENGEEFEKGYCAEHCQFFDWPSLSCAIKEDDPEAITYNPEMQRAYLSKEIQRIEELLQKEEK